MPTGLLLQHECDMNNPEEHFLWSYVALELTHGHSVPLLTKPEILRKWSARQYKAGYRHNPDLQEIEYVPPAMGHSPFGPTGTWVDTAKAVELKAKNEAIQAEQLAAMRKQVAEMMPDVVGRLEGLSDEERAAAAEDLKKQLQDQMKKLADALTVLDADGKKE
ncbi:hypothetical protein ROP_40520 [Rhodococcus opacus B4]|uniref:Uncharacterized protein n=2 Tax=Rhodococcus opacus TaxID=37919 RepID=C1B9E6_RHOOB|nr:hypothetical protein ROP_40520 [Rhodococcus opacus B4]